MVLTGIGSGLYNLTSKHVQVLGDIDKIVTSTIITKIGSSSETTTHNLQNGDISKLNVVPNLSVGIGTTTPMYL